MTLKEELEILRGEPIEVFTSDPMDIPCIETSDSEKLCKNPIVSVQMITYNHEPYIRQAIEGVMMQQTDFEFELVIGEDCSQDKTREICFEYQKKYPDKIRVLWWHKNVSKLGGNSRRCRAQCRGEFIALCEGDDYWIDPLKLQKQVDCFRDNPSVVLQFACTKIFNQRLGLMLEPSYAGVPIGLVQGCQFAKNLILERQVSRHRVNPEGLRTLTAIYRVSAFNDAMRRYSEIFSWRLSLGDTTLWIALSEVGDVYYSNEQFGVYRRHSGGATSYNYRNLMRDATVVKMFFACRALGYDFGLAVLYYEDEIFQHKFYALMEIKDLEARLGMHNAMCDSAEIKILMHRISKFPFRIVLRHFRVLPRIVYRFWGLYSRYADFKHRR